MLKQQRHKMILEYLKKHQFAHVDTLVNLTKSTAITTRRDINQLSDEGLLEKVHGGAQAIQVQMHDINVQDRMKSLTHSKLAIATKAADLIPQKSLIYLDAGTSVHYLIPFLQDKNVTVVTHGIHHIEKLAQHKIKTELVGGHVKMETLAAVGAGVVDAISKIHFDLAIMGTNAIDQEFGLSTPDFEEAQIKSKIIEQAQDVIVLADASKFNKKSKVQFSPLVGKIITDYSETDYDDLAELIKVNSK